MADEEERPTFKSTIHGHPVYCDEGEAREYLRELDSDEADTLFDRAKSSGRVDFEIPRGNSRYNYHMLYDAGAYIVRLEGREGGSGWF